MGTMLEAKDLAKSFGDFAAVKGVSFEIKQGEIFSLLGPNGAGKTTTISMLSCLIKPTAGDAVIDGHSVSKQTTAVKKIIGVVPQEIALYDTLSASENLFFWGRMYGLGGALLARRVKEVLEMIGLTDKAGNKVGTYSGGMKRRVNIGVGLLHGPKILYMDEPTVGIDPQSRRNILDAVKTLNQQGMTVLYTTHYMEEAEELSHRVAIMDHGQIIAIGTQPELTKLVGEDQSLTLHIPEDQNPADLLEALNRLPTITSAVASNEMHTVTVMLPNIKESLALIFSQADEKGMRIHSIDIKEPNLEAVFLHLTGRALRD
jgi:ABC-2 type transport system ATP-binding protein